MPALSRLMAGGTAGTLDSTMPALTPAAWSSIITGKNPGKHAIFDMTRRRPHSYESMPVNGRMRLGTPFWKRLNEAGLRVGLVNIPFTYPPDEVAGFVVPGFGAPGSVSNLVYPREALADIEEKYGRYEPVVSPELLRSGRYQDIYEAEAHHQANQVAIAIDLAAKYDVDVLAINLMLLDHMNHKMPDIERVEAAILQLDKDLQALLDGFVPDNVMVISDHGTRRVKGDFLLHVWLRDNGYSVQKKRLPTEKAAIVNWIFVQWLQRHRGWSGFGEKAARFLLRKMVAALPAGWLKGFWARVERDIPGAQVYAEFSEELDYEKTRVYPGASYSSVLYFNVKGREPQGVVDPAEVAALAAEIRQKLTAVTDPDSGEPLFTAVYTADELYTGAAKVIAPDIIIDSYAAKWNILSTFRRGAHAEALRDRYFANNFKDFGHHSRDGIFVFAGEAFRSDGSFGTAGSVMDVPATLLHLCGVPVPNDWDGRSLTETFNPAFLAAHPLTCQPGDAETAVTFDDGLYSDEENDEIFSHLRALGYVD